MHLSVQEKDKHSKTNNIIIFDYLHYVFIKDKKLITQIVMLRKKRLKSTNLSN